MPIVHSETAFDGSHMEMSCPVGWTFRRDKSVKGYPYVLESDPGYRLQLGWSRDVRMNYGDSISLPDIHSEPVRLAYVMTLHEAHWSGGSTVHGFIWAFLRDIRNSAAKVRRHDFTALTGFTYETSAGWAGHFVRAPWHLYVVFSKPSSSARAKEDEAFEILGTLEFVEHASAV